MLKLFQQLEFFYLVYSFSCYLIFVKNSSINIGITSASVSQSQQQSLHLPQELNEPWPAISQSRPRPNKHTHLVLFYIYFVCFVFTLIKEFFCFVQSRTIAPSTSTFPRLLFDERVGTILNKYISKRATNNNFIFVYAKHNS